jgi:alpha-tubulin suppressor-like RCC1 family protein
VLCWGGNSSGALGNGSITGSPTPVIVLGLSDAIAVSADGVHTCALRATGEVLCWGAGDRGQTGQTEAETLIPAVVHGL